MVQMLRPKIQLGHYSLYKKNVVQNLGGIKLYKHIFFTNFKMQQFVSTKQEKFFCVICIT